MSTIIWNEIRCRWFDGLSSDSLNTCRRFPTYVKLHWLSNEIVVMVELVNWVNCWFIFIFKFGIMFVGDMRMIGWFVRYIHCHLVISANTLSFSARLSFMPRLCLLPRLSLLPRLCLLLPSPYARVWVHSCIICIIRDYLHSFRQLFRYPYIIGKSRVRLWFAYSRGPQLFIGL